MDFLFRFECLKMAASSKVFWTVVMIPFTVDMFYMSVSTLLNSDTLMDFFYLIGNSASVSVLRWQPDFFFVWMACQIRHTYKDEVDYNDK